jgi:hypothetical protein
MWHTILLNGGKWKKILLNGINTVISVKLGGKNWNSLLKICVGDIVLNIKFFFAEVLNTKLPTFILDRRDYQL